MKRIITLFLATMLAIQALAYENYSFSAKCNSGQTLYYKITSNIEPYTVTITHPEEPTCQCVYTDYIYNGYSKPTGNLDIPDTVTYRNKNYAVTSIGEYAFYECSLTSVTIPESVTNIEEHAFYGCSSLTSINIPNSIPTIGEWAFGGCSGLKMVRIPNSVNAIGDGAFGGCTSLSKIVIPNSVRTIGAFAFSRSNKLSIITIPKSVVWIGESAFFETNISVLLEAGVATGGFDKKWNKISGNNYSYSTLTPQQNSCVYQNDMVFLIKDNSNVALYGYLGNNNFVVVPEKIKVSGKEYTVTYIDNNAFENVNYVIDYTGITNGRPWGANKICADIDENGFIYADIDRTHLAAYVGEGSVITIPNTVTTIEDSVFNNCNYLTSITIPKTVTCTGDNVFDNCENIDYSNYKGCRYIGNDENPFYALFAVNSTDMSNFEINSNCKVICGGAFRNCDKPTNITIPESVVSICDKAFDGCSGLVEVSIPNSVTYIAKNAFTNCNNIAKLTYNTNAIKDCFSGKTQITEINIGNSVTKIDTNAFSGCNNLTNIVLPYNIASVGYNAFNCSNLKQIVCLMEKPATLVADPFPNNDSIFVPNASVDAYERASFWRKKIILPIIAAESANITQGSVNVNCDTNTDNTVIITATPAEHYHFVSWSDGDTNNPRTLTASAFMQLIAMFEVDECTVIVSTNSATSGSATGSGSYHYGDTATFTASPTEGYHFVKWNDENTDNPRYYFVANDVSLAAIFAGHTIVTDAAVAATCTATGLTAGKHCSVCNATIVAQKEISALGHEFVKYVYNNDATTTANGTETATCERGCGTTDTRVKEGTKLATTAVSESAANAVNIYAHGNTIVVENATEEIRVYNAMGALVGRDVARNVSTIPVNGTGVYIVKTSGMVKRVMVN